VVGRLPTARATASTSRCSRLDGTGAARGTLPQQGTGLPAFHHEKAPAGSPAVSLHPPYYPNVVRSRSIHAVRCLFSRFSRILRNSEPASQIGASFVGSELGASGRRLAPTPLTPTGARRVGEIGINGPGAATAGAVADALGLECPAPRRLSLTPPRVWALAGVSRHDASP
jgi:hypothetical protein